MPWWVAGIVGGVGSAAVMWVLVTGAFALGWLATPDIDFGAVFRAGTRAWLLGYFAPAELGGVRIAITPLGLTALAVLVGTWFAGFAASQARLAAPVELTGRQRRSLAVRLIGVFTLFHTVAVLVPSFFVAPAEDSARALLGGFGVGLLCVGIGAMRGLQWDVLAELPRWLRPVPAAVAVSVLTMVATGALVTALGLWRQRARVGELHQSLQPDTMGTILLVALQLLWLPNAVVWGSSWALGAGFSIGTGTFVAPAATELGLVPTIPMLGALPANGPASTVNLWWLLSGVLAGALGAVVVLRQRPRARFDETALVGGLTGVLSGLVLMGLGVIASGGLGSARLVEVGVRSTALFVMAPTLLGLAGVTTGAVAGLLRPPPRAVDTSDSDDAEAAMSDESHRDADGRDADVEGADEPTNKVERGDQR